MTLQKKASSFTLLSFFVLAALFFRPMWAQADDAEPAQTTAPSELGTFGMMYGSQWAFYLVSQSEIIEKHGSFQNWLNYPSQPVFDKDSFDFNIFKHSLAGNYYYLYYRAHGYSEFEAFTWTFFSSLAFEFTIETVTEKPSLQDIYQTPIYGTIVGMGAERFSNYLFTLNSPIAHAWGYLINPFRLIWNKPSEKEMTITPQWHPQNPGILLSWRY